MARAVGVPDTTAGQWLRGDRVPQGYQMGWLILALHMTAAELEYLVGKPKSFRDEESAAAGKKALRERTLSRSGSLDELKSEPAPRAAKPPKDGRTAHD